MKRKQKQNKKNEMKRKQKQNKKKWKETQVENNGEKWTTNKTMKKNNNKKHNKKQNNDFFLKKRITIFWKNNKREKCFFEKNKKQKQSENQSKEKGKEASEFFSPGDGSKKCFLSEMLQEIVQQLRPTKMKKNKEKLNPEPLRSHSTLQAFYLLLSLIRTVYSRQLCRYVQRAWTCHSWQHVWVTILLLSRRLHLLMQDSRVKRGRKHVCQLKAFKIQSVESSHRGSCTTTALSWKTKASALFVILARRWALKVCLPSAAFSQSSRSFVLLVALALIFAFALPLLCSLLSWSNHPEPQRSHSALQASYLSLQSWRRAILSAFLRSSRDVMQARCLSICSKTIRLSLLTTQFRHSRSGESTRLARTLPSLLRRPPVKSNLISPSMSPADLLPSFGSHLDTNECQALWQETVVVHGFASSPLYESVDSQSCSCSSMTPCPPTVVAAVAAVAAAAHSSWGLKKQRAVGEIPANSERVSEWMSDLKVDSM